RDPVEHALLRSRVGQYTRRLLKSHIHSRPTCEARRVHARSEYDNVRGDRPLRRLQGTHPIVRERKPGNFAWILEARPELLSLFPQHAQGMHWIDSAFRFAEASHAQRAG